MKFVSTAKSIEEFRADVVQYLEIRAEQNRAAEKCFSSQKARMMYLHAASEIQSIADDVRFMKVA